MKLGKSMKGCCVWEQLGIRWYTCIFTVLCLEPEDLEHGKLSVVRSYDIRLQSDFVLSSVVRGVSLELESSKPHVHTSEPKQSPPNCSALLSLQSPHSPIVQGSKTQRHSHHELLLLHHPSSDTCQSRIAMAVAVWFDQQPHPHGA